VKTLDPAGYIRRAHNLNVRPRGEYIVPGPDYLWSIDGHDKLKPWGIEIFAGEDAYARKVIWVYIGISNKSTTSVLVQYLVAIQSYGRHPQYLRSDCGTETPILAEIHYGLSRTTQPNIAFIDTYFFGTSTRNIRIESWWSQLEKSCLYRWRVSIIL
jgi:hypothetical protein